MRLILREMTDKITEKRTGGIILTFLLSYIYIYGIII